MPHVPSAVEQLGLTVRWSLADAPDDTLERLADHVATTSHARFEGMGGLRFKTWRARPGEWFEGCYVFVDDAARAAFQADFEATAADAPGSRIVGRPPESVEACVVVAVAEGPDGLVSCPRSAGPPGARRPPAAGR